MSHHRPPTSHYGFTGNAITDMPIILPQIGSMFQPVCGTLCCKPRLIRNSNHLNGLTGNRITFPVSLDREAVLLVDRSVAALTPEVHDLTREPSWAC
jgi:hypothetical protein